MIADEVLTSTENRRPDGSLQTEFLSGEPTEKHSHSKAKTQAFKVADFNETFSDNVTPTFHRIQKLMIRDRKYWLSSTEAHTG
jgi:hypothetical protein